MEERKSLNPYLGGALAGILLTLSVVFTNNFFGTSTTLVRLAGKLESLLAPSHFASLKYFQQIPPLIDWQAMFVAGIFIGSLVSAIVAGDFKMQAVPDMWQKKLGPSRGKRFLAAFVGGIIAVIGARIAGGCPSGQLSAMVQLSLLGFIAMPFFFLGGLTAVRFIYRGRD
ncbi:hypothetical protein SAMN02745221_01457 [Thermosyntropha lipolytica DSM 11003]|uniref:Uncharacterized protein n=1 Tax=Thermosyntropha lipolytica DSM 11003 TaxID=1123382 RepID=A0A1M5PF37_9FIRM|nr:YeeE/YedE thiosulfate transporter family protein [Thermosyntropha lipolytica]SHH00370.1 hypothetical protein SAMN02745221_01457 [Thermosyntropha lipolytica DSM 11003]